MGTFGTNRIYSVGRMVKVADCMRWGFAPARFRFPLYLNAKIITNPSSLADECNFYSLALLFDVSFQILSSTTSVQVINIQGTEGMTIGHVNSTQVKHFVGTKLF